MSDLKKGNYVEIHGIKNGFVKVEVLPKPCRGTKQDFIKLSWSPSARKKIDWVCMDDMEAHWVIQLLTAALQRRLDPIMEMTLIGTKR